MCIDLGWTRDEVLDQVDLDFVQALNKEWTKAPPVRQMVAAFAGYEKPEEKTFMTADAARMAYEATGGRIDGVQPMNNPAARR